MGEANNFSVVQARRRGRDAVILIDTALDAARLAPRYPYLLTVTLPIRHANAQGLCDDRESERLSDLEDALLAPVDRSDYRYVGRVTWNGVREVLLHVADPERCARRLASEAFELDPEEEIEVSVEAEPSWATYRKIVG